MSDFYKQVATPETSMVRSASPSGPERNLQAEVDAQEETGFGSAIKNLLGTVNVGVKAYNQDKQLDKQANETVYGLDADADTRNVANFSKVFVEDKLRSEGKSVTDVTQSELDEMYNEASRSYIEENKLQEKPYFNIVQDRINQKNSLLRGKASEERQQAITTKYVGIMGDNITSKMTSGLEPKDIADYIRTQLAENVGPDKRIQDTNENVLERVMMPLMQTAVSSGNPDLVIKLKSPELKEIFGNVPAYDNIVQVAEKKAVSVVTAKQEENFNRLEEHMYTLADAGGFIKSSDVDENINGILESIPDFYKPSSKDIFNLRQKMYKQVENTTNTLGYLEAFSRGDFTYLERQDLKEREKEQIRSEGFKTMTGMTGLSPRDIDEAMVDDKTRNAMSTYYKAGGTHPKEIKEWAKATPLAYTSIDEQTGESKYISFTEASRIKINTYEELSNITVGSGNNIDNAFAPKDLSKMLFLKRLVEGVDGGNINEAEAQTIYNNFNSDLDKKVDSLGVYRDENTAAQMKDITEWAQEQTESIPNWTTDPFSTPDYTTNALKGNVSLFLAAGLPLDEAQDRAVDMFESSHLIFEAPDGSESAIGGDFVSFRGREDAFTEVAMNLDSLAEERKVDTWLGNDYFFRSNISVRPTRDFHKTGQIAVYYKGKEVENSRMNHKQFSSMYDQLNTKEKKRIERDYARNLEEKVRLSREADTGIYQRPFK